MTEDTAKKMKALERANKWAAAGKEAHDLALITEKAAIEGEIVPVTPENLAITFKGAIKLFLDGNIKSQNIVKKMQASGLDMNNLRRAIVEETMERAITKIINDGDLDKLSQLAEMAGEKPEMDIQGAKKIVRERVEITIDD